MVEPAPWPPPGCLGLPDAEVLEAASQIVALPLGGHLVPIPLPKHKEPSP